jgi:uncharacterized protein YbjT (DUF2867 family)
MSPVAAPPERSGEALGSSVPDTIVQVTQFFEFLTRIADAATHGNAVRAPPVRIQPIAANDVARAVARIGGPGPFCLNGSRVLGARSDPREVIADSHARCFGTELDPRESWARSAPVR